MSGMIPKQKAAVRSPPFPTTTHRPKQPLKVVSGLSKPSPRSTLMRAHPAFSCRASRWVPWPGLPLLSPPWCHRSSLNEVRGVARCVESAQARASAAGACAPNPTPRARHSTPGVGWGGLGDPSCSFLSAFMQPQGGPDAGHLPKAGAGTGQQQDC